MATACKRRKTQTLDLHSAKQVLTTPGGQSTPNSQSKNLEMRGGT